MKGRNELHISEGTMVEVVQQWLNATMVPGHVPVVTAVSYRGGGGGDAGGGKGGGEQQSREPKMNPVFVVTMEPVKTEPVA